MKFSDIDKVDPLLTKLRITDGNTHIPPRSASKHASSTPISSTNNNDIISRSQYRRENLLSSYNELKKYQRHDAVVEDKEEEVTEEYRGTSYRTRKLWDFDIAVKEKEESSPAPTARRTATTADGGLWTAKDVRREARESVTRQVKKDILEMEQLHEGMKKRISQHSPSVSGKKVLDEVWQATVQAMEKAKLRSNLSDEENTNINVIDDGYGKMVSPRKAQRNKGPYRGINEEDFLPNSSEEYVSTSSARLQRMRELNKQNYEHKLTNSKTDVVDERIEAKKSYESSDSADEIMPAPPRYLRLIKERTGVDSESDEPKTNSRPPFSPPKTRPETTKNPIATTRTSSQSPPKQPLTATTRQRSASPFNSRDEIAKARTNVRSPPRQPLTSTNMQRSASPFSSRDEIAKARAYSQSAPRGPITSSTKKFSTPPSKSEHRSRSNTGSPSTFYVSTKESESMSVKSGLSEGTPCETSNNIVQSTLSTILNRIDEAKENFKTALAEGDIKKQAELADLITRLGEAAVTMRKLEGL